MRALPSSWRYPLSEPCRVLLCDDHTIMRSGLRRILNEAPDIVVVAEAGTAAAAVEAALTERPDVIVMDLTLPDESGITAIERIRAAGCASRALVLTMHDDIAYVREAFAAGAAGYLLKAAADVELLRAVREVASGMRYVDPTMGAALVDGRPQPRSLAAGAVLSLSERELEILRLLALGYTNPEMAANLNLSVRTIETYRSRIQKKVGLRSRAELAGLARDSGLTR
ncbi:response regulator [Streptomyces sp. cg40]|uniref:response regulator n=1 Tax=Streptomyces sp. cg40 TaxID=3419764 RepID=UPI003D03D13F